MGKGRAVAVLGGGDYDLAPGAPRVSLVFPYMVAQIVQIVVLYPLRSSQTSYFYRTALTADAVLHRQFE